MIIPVRSQAVVPKRVVYCRAPSLSLPYLVELLLGSTFHVEGSRARPQAKLPGAVLLILLVPEDMLHQPARTPQLQVNSVTDLAREALEEGRLALAVFGVVPNGSGVLERHGMVDVKAVSKDWMCLLFVYCGTKASPR